MTRAPQLKLALLCCLAALTLGPTARALTVQQEPGGLRVRTASYSALIDPSNGARITSLQVDGAEMTRLCPDGHGGLFEETRSADFPFQLVRQDRDERHVLLALAAEAGPLRIVKEFSFNDEAPSFSVTLRFENHSPFALSGADAPALRNLVLPADGEATGRELYCMGRGRGAEVLSADLLLARMYGDGPAGALRWMAVAEPAGRRALGFALAEDGSRPLPPLRARGGGLLTGWHVPSVPAGSSLTVHVLVVPLRGFTALAELNPRFAADVLAEAAPSGRVIHLSLMPLAPLPDLSVITRRYDAEGRELEPCDPLLFDRLEALKIRQGDVACRPDSGSAAWFVHEIYSEGRKLGQFAVSVDQPPAPCPVRAGPMPQALTAALPEARAPGAGIPLTPERTDRGFVFFRFEGAPASDELGEVRLALGAQEKHTAFFGLRALRALESLQVSVAAPAASASANALPPAASYLWRVSPGASGRAVLEPYTEGPVPQGETLWLALTADAARLEPGPYAARLVLSAGQGALDVPVSVQVMPQTGELQDGFGLWYLGAGGPGSLDEQAMVKLRDYGVQALTLPLDEAASAAVRAGLPDAPLNQMRALVFGSSGGALAPSGPAPGALPLPCPDPLWLVRVGAATPAAALAAAQAGYRPALLCERLTAVPQEFFGSAGPRERAVWLVEGGADSDAVSHLVSSGQMDGSQPVWLYLDLRGVDWRRAAVQVRSAAWAAAWQGLAGLAVTCQPPEPAVDRQLALWHILSDACREAALWRQLHRAVSAAASPQTALALEAAESIVGPSDRDVLPLEAERAPFRRLYRVAAPPGAEALSLGPFAEARWRTLDLVARLGPPAPASGPAHIYWRGIPLSQDGRVRWAICAADGDQAWSAALSFQQALHDLSGLTVPLSRAWPAGSSEGPALVWAFADEAPWAGPPDEVGAAINEHPGAVFLVVNLQAGATAAVVRPGLNIKELLGSLQPEPDLYPTARGVR